MGITTGTRDAWNISYCCDLGKPDSGTPWCHHGYDQFASWVRYSGILDLAFLACSMAKQLRCGRHHREVLRARHRGRAERPSEGTVVERVILDERQHTNAHASAHENHDGTREHHRGSGTRILPRVHRRLGPRGVQNDIEYLTTHQRDHECRGTAHNSVDAPFTT